MMLQTPFGHDRSAPRDDARHAVGGQRHEPQQHAGVDGHVVHALLALFDHGVAEQLPAEFGGVVLHLFKRLVHRDRADRHGGVPEDPFAGGVDVVAGGKIHHSVGSPLGGPCEFLHLLVDGGGHCGIAHVGVELGKESRADDHRLGLGMVDIARHDRATCGQFGTYQLHVAVLAFGNITHLRCDDVVTRIPHLGNRMVLRLKRLMLAATPFLGCLAAFDGAFAVILEIAPTALVLLDIPAIADPVETQRRQSFLRVALGTFGVVILERRVRAYAWSVGQLDFGIWHFKVVGAESVFEMHWRGFADMRLVALLGAAGGDVYALLLGQFGRGLRFLGVREFPVVALRHLRIGGRCRIRRLHSRREAMLRFPAYGLPTGHHLTGGRLRIVRTGDR